MTEQYILGKYEEIPDHNTEYHYIEEGAPDNLVFADIDPNKKHVIDAYAGSFKSGKITIFGRKSL